MTDDRRVSESEGAANLRCRSCKSKGRRVFTLTTVEWAHDGRPASYTTITVDGQTSSVRDRYSVDRALWMRCPSCGSFEITVNRVKGSNNEDKACGARCRNATSGDCECSCVGANHGSANTAW